MRRISEKTMEVSFTKRIVAIAMMVSYISVTSPLPLFAESVKSDTEAKRTVSVREEKSEVLISAEEGGTVTLGEASIEIPEGALRKDTRISITRLLKVEDTGESLCNAIPHSGGYRFLPAGTKFEKDVTITLPYSSELNAKPQSLDELYTYYYDTQKKSWIKLERLEVDRESHRVRSLSTHFTDMINATLTMPESASPVDVNLNSIKNLEAAKPDSHLIKFNPPKASNMGDASFSFELAVPAGRKGMQPQISVSYSSGGGNGIMGKGFDVSYGSSITTDTRFGLPNYDTRDTYMLDGILLEEKTRKGNEITYKPLKETSFSRIKRFMSDNHWEVTDKNGTKKIYGIEASACTGSGSKIFVWNITMTQDVHGNNVVYEYEKSDGYVYPKNIYYTGFDGKKGNYKVQFHYDSDGLEKRQDVHIDARSREIISCKKLLTGITTHYGSDTAAIRSYAFTYKEGLAKEKMLTALTVSNNADESYAYTFEYNEPEYENEKVKYFANAEVWHNGTAIKTGKSTSGGGSFNTSAGVGVGELSGTVDARLTGGAQGSFSNSNSETESMLSDIDGDGSPDYIRVKGGTLYYRLNQKNGFSEEEKSIPLEKIKLDDENSQNLSIGWNIYGGGGLKKSFVSGLGATYSDVSQTTTSNSTVALNDVNGDRKTDIILSGKNYYLKNTSKNGNVSFERELYDGKNSTVVENNIKKLTADEIKAYKEQYKTQTPFRQWKSQYDGTISVTQNLSVAGSFDQSNSVKAHVYKGNSETSVSSLESMVSGTKSSEKLNASLSVTKDENLYFITETDEPLNSDINYNIKIDYTDIKSYKAPLKVPVFFPEQRINSQILPEALSPIYNTTTETQSGVNGNNIYCPVYVLKETWQNSTDKETYSQLVSQGRFLPGAFTENQFDKILESFSSKTNTIINKRFFTDDANEELTEKIIYERFAACFIHDLTNKIYIIRDNNDIKLFDLLYNTLGQKEVLIDSWNNYRLFDIDAVYDKNGIIYEQKSEVTSIDARRGSDITGTQLENGNVIILGDYDGKLLTASIKNGKVFFDNIEQQDFTAQFEKQDGENKGETVFIVTLVHTSDNEKIIYNLTDFKPKALNLSKEELQLIVDEYTILYESINDSYWNWNEKLEDDAYECLEAFGMNTNQQKRFLELVYDKTVKEIIEEEEKKQITVYTKKQNLVGQNLIDASGILADVKFNTIIKNEFSYYEKSDNDEYNLKDLYIADITDDDTPTRKDDESKIIEKCNNHGFGKYCLVQVFIRHDESGLYKLDDNSKFSSRRIVSGAISITEEKYSPGKTSWDSSSTWSGITHSDEKVLYEEKNQDEDAVIQVERQEKLFAGNSNWFFGIWINGKTAFNGKNIESIFAAKDHTKYDYDKEKLKDMSKEDAAEKKGTNEEQPFYLPVFNTEISDSEIYPVKKEYAANKNDVENALIGQVSMSSLREEDEEGNYIMVTQYYFPFIQGDYIHAGRVGGNTFYNIEGIKTSDSKSSSFVFPNVRMSRNEGNDTTFGVSVDLAVPNISEFVSGDDLYKLIEQTNIGNFGGTSGTNTSNGNLTQTVMDLNGDSIPDIIQQAGSGINVIPGIKTKDGISYGSSYFIDNININSTSSATEIKGASVSPNGSVSLTISKNGKVIGATPSPSVSGGAGCTVVTGSSSVNSGFIDLNGDGLPDYFNGTSVSLNQGKKFSTSSLVTVNAGSMNTSSLSSAAVNANIRKSSSRGESLKTGVSLGTGLSYSVSSNTSETMYLDINGDGLADKLVQRSGSIAVFYNTGNSFVQADDILLPSWNVNSTEQSYLQTGKDVNFDLGLFGDQPLIGPLTKGLVNVLPVCNPFAIDDIDNMEFSSTVSLSMSGNVGVSFTFPIKIPIAGISINITCSGGNGLSGSSSINCVNVSMMDLDGDGLADHVLRVPGYCTYWKRNISGRYGQLTQVNLPQGGNVKIEYSEQYGTVDNPNFKYVMSRVTMNDGTDKDDVLPELKHGAHSVTTYYEYSDGYYDRNKKDFYGFGTVKTTFAYGNWQEDVYYNREYYSKGCVSSSTVKTADGALLSESTTTLEDAPYALPVKEESKTYEKSSGDGNYIYSATSYSYDLLYGNCVKVVQNFGDSETLTGEISYKNIDTNSQYITGLPIKILVYGKNGETNPLRLRTGDYDSLGQLTELSQYWANNESCRSTNRLTYDDYGNIETVSDSRGATLSYKYDDVEYMFVREITQRGSDTESYTSFIEYDEATQTKKSEADCNGNKLSYEYDSWQRIKEIWTSYDTGTTPAIRYEYSAPARNIDGKMNLWYAITNNKVTFDEDDSAVIQTVIQIDGLGRAVRTAKTGCVNGVEGWNASGAVEYDDKGRTVKEGMTEFIEGGLDDLLSSTPKMTNLFTSYEYDEKDRQVKTILPDGSAQTNAFYIEENRLISETIDPLGNVSVQETDSRGNIVRVAKNDKDGKQLTEVTYRYNAMGEMLKAFDAKGHPITAEYDLLGRRTALESLDSGRQEFFYDECSNLVRENNSVLKENNKQIVYIYDGLNRLIKIDYPDSEDTVYTYGKPSDKAVGAAGKILKVKDASGTIEYVYGSLGEVKKDSRVLNTHLNGNNPTETAVMEYQSDYLGRMQWIIYPDGEKVTYGYDRGGQVISVTGEHYGHSFEYVTNILYDQYGQRTRIDYGNGTFTEYNYDPARRWLDSIKTENKWGQSYQNISYSFDAVGNVLGYENDCLDSVTGNYRTKQTYGYDNLYQLIKVEGETTYNPYHSSAPEFNSNYSQLFDFDSDGLGNMTSKISTETVSPNKAIGDNLNYSFNYVYDENYAHRLINAGERYYKYDANGNITAEQDGSFESNGTDTAYHKIEQETDDVYSTDYGWGLFSEENGSDGGVKGSKYCRTYKWNERNQLISSVDSNYNTAYVYGQDGQRSNKYTGNSETLYFNKMWTHHTDSGNSIYGGQTSKNIYLGETRIVTKLNSGEEPTYQEEFYKQYYYHSDHLGSASLISDYKGDEYQRIEYTPYGETWVEKTSNTGLEYLPYKFTAKELDEETGLYYYGARYLDPKYSMWISTDPALGEYIPKAPIDEEARKHNQNLPGMGGVFNHINCNLYHYAGNNPIKYTDPDGRLDITSFYIPDFCSYVKGTENKLAVPLGGNLTSTQKDISKIQDLLTLGLSFVPDVGAFASVPGSDFSIETAISLVETLVGIVAENAGTVLAFVDLLNILASDPDIVAKNYSKDQMDFVGKCAVEQLFIKDFSDALTKKGIINSKIQQGSFIMNLEIFDVPLFSDELIEIANEVKNSNPLYKDVEIHY
ncbi:toxin TcdB middle/N-terminal domain-containing protein [Treponema sp.]|uniref:toxin TcdB middle/N-terminal domain-containing protein n=2 Tax=Bacteria TaxID=2 RepID=UPI003EFC10EE